MRIEWDDEAKAAFLAALNYISERSLQGADTVFQAVEVAVASLVKFPFRHRASNDRLANDGSYRTFVIRTYRIDYHVGEDEIRIVRFRHTSQQPEFY